MRIALLGCGRFAGVHTDYLRRVAGDSIEITAASRSEEKAQATAAKLGLQGYYSPYEAALEASEIDAVFVLTPHDMHALLAEKAVQCGKHVFVEKPIARHVAEAERICRAQADTPGRIVMVGENARHSMALVRGCALLREGRIGQLHSIVANAIRHVVPRDWRTRRAEMGGGALIDGGIHLVHAMRAAGGEIAAVCGVEPAVKTNTIEGEECLQILVQFVSGATGVLTYSWGKHGDPAAPNLLILGTEGSIALNLWQDFVTVYAPGGGGAEQISVADAEHPTWDAGGHAATTAEFLECIAAGRKPLLSVQEGLRDVAVVEAVYRSLKTRTLESPQPLPDWVC